jgi:hypothetical protein
VCTYARIRYHSVGDPHSIVVNALRVPAAAIASQIAWPSLPAETSSFVSSIGFEAYGGISVALEKSGDTASFVAHIARTDTDRETFYNVNADRGAAGMLAWVVWIYGLRSTDQIALDYGSHAEYVANSSAVAIVNPGLIGAVSPNGAASDLVGVVSDTVTATGRDGGLKPPDSMFKRVVNALWSEKARDTLDNSAEAIAGIISGNYLGAGKSIARAIQPWLLYNHTVKTPDGLCTIHPGYYAKMQPSISNGTRSEPTRVDDTDHERKDEDYDFLRRASAVPQTPRVSVRSGVLDSRCSSSASQVPSSDGRRQ